MISSINGKSLVTDIIIISLGKKAKNIKFVQLKGVNKFAMFDCEP